MGLGVLSGCKRCFSTDLTTFLGTGSGGKGESYCQSSGRPESQFLLWAVWQTVHQTPGVWQPHKLLWPCSQAGTCDTNVFGIVNLMFFRGTAESIVAGVFRFHSGLVFMSHRGSKNWSRESLLGMCHHAPAKMERSKKRCCVDYMSLLNRENSLTGKILPQERPLLAGWFYASEVHVNVEHIRCLGKMIVWMCFLLNSLKWTALSQVHKHKIFFIKSCNLYLSVLQEVAPCSRRLQWP